MHIYHILNLFNKQYGKIHKSVNFSIHGDHIIMEAVYDTDEKVLFKIWLETTKADYIKTNVDRYKLILWKDKIYTNDYKMPNEEKQVHFFETLNKMSTCPADHMLGQYEIVLDKKIVQTLHAENQECIKKLAETISKFNYKEHCNANENEDLDLFRYNRAVYDLPGHIDMERYLTNELKAIFITSLISKNSSQEVANV